MDSSILKPALPTVDGAVFRIDVSNPAFDRSLDDGTDVMLERQDETGQFAVKTVAFDAAQTSYSQALSVTAAVPEMPLTLIPVPQ